MREPGRSGAAGSRGGEHTSTSLDRMHEQLFPAAAGFILMDTPHGQSFKGKPSCLC